MRWWVLSGTMFKLLFVSLEAYKTRRNENWLRSLWFAADRSFFMQMTCSIFNSYKMVALDLLTSKVQFTIPFLRSSKCSLWLLSIGMSKSSTNSTQSSHTGTYRSTSDVSSKFSTTCSQTQSNSLDKVLSQCLPNYRERSNSSKSRSQMRALECPRMKRIGYLKAPSELAMLKARNLIRTQMELVFQSASNSARALMVKYRARPLLGLAVSSLSRWELKMSMARILILRRHQTVKKSEQGFYNRMSYFNMSTFQTLRKLTTSKILIRRELSLLDRWSHSRESILI